MNNIPVKIFCPLGSECESVKDGSIHRCAWYTPVRGTNQNTGEEIDDWACAMKWMPFLTIENSAFVRQSTASIDEFRKETGQANAVSQQILLTAVQQDVKLIDVQKCE